MRYTTSEDGVERATIYVPLRVTRDQLRLLNRIAKAAERDTRSMLSSWMALAVEGNVEDGALEASVLKVPADE